MDNPIHHYWELRLLRIKKALEANNFDVYIADNKDLAKKMAYETILPAIAPKTISWGGSMTFVGTRLYEALKNDPRYAVLDTYDKSLSPEQSTQRRRESLLVDLFITRTGVDERPIIEAVASLSRKLFMWSSMSISVNRIRAPTIV